MAILKASADQKALEVKSHAYLFGTWLLFAEKKRLIGTSDIEDWPDGVIKLSV